MFKPIRRSERQLTSDEAEKILQLAEYGYFSTVGEDGWPYAVPVNYVYFNNAIYFHCATVGHKLDNISYSSKACFSVTGSSHLSPEKLTTFYKSVVAFGYAEVLSTDEIDIPIIELMKKYAADQVDKAAEIINRSRERVRVVKISVEHLSGKGH